MKSSLVIFSICTLALLTIAGIHDSGIQSPASTAIENIKCSINSIKYHDGSEIKPDFKYIRSCDIFELKRTEKGDYHYRISDCCNRHDGTLILDQSRIFVLSRRSTLNGCFPNFAERQKENPDSVLQQEKYELLLRDGPSFLPLQRPYTWPVFKMSSNYGTVKKIRQYY